jgi:hypothetical protein
MNQLMRLAHSVTSFVYRQVIPELEIESMMQTHLARHSHSAKQLLSYLLELSAHSISGHFHQRELEQ